MLFLFHHESNSFFFEIFIVRYFRRSLHLVIYCNGHNNNNDIKLKENIKYNELLNQLNDEKNKNKKLLKELDKEKAKIKELNDKIEAYNRSI